MNSIQAIIDKSDYENYSDYLNFWIDNCFLDDKLNEVYPENELKGLIPTLDWGMESPHESNIVWNRILPAVNKRTICPILMCPDDLDFSCTLIVADILRLEKVVIWERLGIDKTIANDAEKVGSAVEWFDKIKPLSFEIEVYMQMLADFKESFEKGKNNWLKKNNLNDW